MSTVEKLDAVIRELVSIRDSFGTENESAISVMQSLVSSATLSASQARSGVWFAYLIMHKGFRPSSDTTHGWMFNPAGYWWTDTSGKTKDEALRAALKRLIDTKNSKEDSNGE